MAFPQVHLIMFFVFFLLPASSPPPRMQGFRTRLTRVDSGRNLAAWELLQLSVNRSHFRAMARPGRGEFLMDLAIGTPSLQFSAIIDTGSDLTWTQCEPCVGCYPQPTPMFNPSKSSTFSSLPCSSNLCRVPASCNGSDCTYAISYAGQSETRGVLASETFLFGSNPVPGITFGCGHANHGTSVLHQAAGLVGLGRGPLSLISQLQLTKFSYCFARLGTFNKSSMFLGSTASVDGATGPVRSTPIILNPKRPSFYYLSLRGISVGSTLLNITPSLFTIAEDGSGGLIIDSGTSITFLKEEAYREVRKALLSQVDLVVADGSRFGFDLCFEGGGGRERKVVVMPKLVFHFERADMELGEENYMVEDEGVSGGLRCLAMGSGLPMGLSILGNYQQQEMLVLYDLRKDVLSFAPAPCDQL